MNMEQFQIYMFHFCCPVCGSSPKRVLLREYLQRWRDAPSEQLYFLLCALSGALKEIRYGQSDWHTKEFCEAIDSLQRAIEELRFDPSIKPQSSLRAVAPASLYFDAECPVCELPPGPRKPHKHFADWSHAWKDQIGNLLYETGLIFWAILVGLPSWAPGRLLQELNNLRGRLHSTGKAMQGYECPQCGRLTTGLYGSNPRENGFCRWCLDMSGGLGIGISISLNPSAELAVKMMQPDHSEAAKNSSDILPPEIKRRTGERKKGSNLNV